MARGEDQQPPLEDTVDIPNETTQSNEEWPVAELYRIEPPGESVETEPGEAAAVAAAEEPPPPGDRPRHRFPPPVGFAPLFAVTAILMLAALAAWLLISDSRSSATTPPAAADTQPASPSETTPTTSTETSVKPLPDLEGVSLADARALLEAAGLRVRVSDVSSDRPPNEVVRQDPAAGTPAAPDSVVVLFVSRGSQRAITSAPAVVGLRVSAATGSIRRAGLTSQRRLVTSTQTPGTVVAQRPSEGTEMVEGSTVRLDIARAQPIPVPSFKGWERSDARSRLRALGLTSRVVGVTSSAPTGTVVGQSPRAGAQLRKGATVTLKISTGPAKSAVPDVTGLDEYSARAELQAAGFEVHVLYETTTNPAQDGLVGRQEPTGGTSTSEGTVVTLTVLRL